MPVDEFFLFSQAGSGAYKYKSTAYLFRGMPCFGRNGPFERRSIKMFF